MTILPSTGTRKRGFRAVGLGFTVGFADASRNPKETKPKFKIEPLFERAQQPNNPCLPRALSSTPAQAGRISDSPAIRSQASLFPLFLAAAAAGSEAAGLDLPSSPSYDGAAAVEHEEFYQQCFFSRLRVDPEDHAVVLAEPTSSMPDSREAWLR